MKIIASSDNPEKDTGCLNVPQPVPNDNIKTIAMDSRIFLIKQKLLICTSNSPESNTQK